MTADQRFAQAALELGHRFDGEIKIGGNYAPVVRDGQHETVEPEQIVKDDVVLLESGRQICNDAVVIDVTRLFTTELPELSVRPRLRARGFDGARAFVERATSFPSNIEVEAIHTYTIPPEAAPTAGPQGPAREVRPAGGCPTPGGAIAPARQPEWRSWTW